MEKKIFKVTRIEGEYAYLVNTETPSDGELFVALALLPQDADEGSLLEYENFSFTLV